MNKKTIIIVSSVSLLTAFAVGRYSAPVKIKTEVKEVVVEKKVKDIKEDVDKKRNKKTTRVTITKPDGTKETTTVITDDSEINKKKDTSVVTDKTSIKTEIKEITKSSGTLGVYGLVGMDFRSKELTYGLSVDHSLIGPVNLGIWGLTNATGGFSLGLRF